LVMVKVTVFNPAVVYVWPGFWDVLVPLSPKFHCQEVGVPAEVSVNCIDWPVAGEAGLKVKEAASAVVTVTVRLTLLEPELLVMVKVTVFNPAVVYVWLGFWDVLVPPSPKFHCQEVGVPAEVSVNCMDWPVAGEAGLKVKEAASAVVTVTVRLTLLEPELLVTVKVTVLDPAVVYVWLGFWDVLVPPSPKLHCQEVGLPVDVSVNWTDWPVAGEAGLKVKEAASAVATVTARLTLLEPELLVTVKVTVLDPAVVYAWPGFWTVLEVPSPKLHCQEVGLPVDVSVN